MFAELAASWRVKADTLAEHGADTTAVSLRRCADELDAAARGQADELLTLREAALASGYSRDRLRHLVASGVVPNAGRPHAPRVRRGDLPRKPTPAPSPRPGATSRAGRAL
jgi:hypothetical protein